MATPIAEAFILVKPDVSSFASELKKGLGTQLDAIKQNPPKIPVALNLTQKEIQRVQRQIRDAGGVIVPITPQVVGAGRAVQAGAAEAAATTAAVTIDPNTADFQTKLQAAVTSAASKVKASVSVGLVIATGARDKLRDQIKAIPGAVIPVTPVITGRPPVGPTPAGAPPAAPPPAGAPPPAAAGAGATSLSQSAKAAAESSAALEGALVRARLAAQQVAIAEQFAAEETTDLAQAQAALKVATDAANQSAKAAASVQVQAAKLQGEGAEQASRAAGATAAAGETAKATLQERVNLLQKAKDADDAVAAEQQKVADEAQAAADKTAASHQKQADLAKRVAIAEQNLARDVQLAAKGQLDLDVAGDRVNEMKRLSNEVSKEYTRALGAEDDALLRGAEALQESQAENLKRSRSQQDSLQIIQKRIALEDDLKNATLAGADAETRSQRTSAQTKATFGVGERARRLLTVATREGTQADQDAIRALITRSKAQEEAFRLENAIATKDEARLQRRERGLRGALAAGLSFLGLRAQVLAASTAFIVGATAVTAFGKAVASAVDLQTKLAVFRATVGATAVEIERVAATSRELGRDITLPGVGAGDAAGAMLSLAKAGLDVQDAIAGARGVLQLATAAEISFADATNFAAGALNAFGLAGEDAARVADVFANAANASQASIEEIGASMSQVNAVARQVGLTLEDTSALLTLLARSGLKGSDAGTSLRTALLRLVSPTNEAQQVIEDLGLRIRDTQGNLRPEIFAEFGEATKNMSPDVRDATTSLIFGQDAIRAVSIASREGIAGLRAQQQNMKQQGSAAQLAAARTEGLAGAVLALENQLSTLGGTLGSVAIPLLQSLTDLLGGALTGVGAAVQGFQRLDQFFKDSTPTLDKYAKKLLSLATTQGFFEAVIPEGEGEKAEKAVQGLTEIQQATQRLQQDLEKLNLPVDPLKQQSKEIKNAIDSIFATGKVPGTGEIPLSDLDIQLLNAQALKKLLEDAGKSTKGIDAQIKLIQKAIGSAEGITITGPDFGGAAFPAESPLDRLLGGLDRLPEGTARIQTILGQLKGDVKSLDPSSPVFESTLAAVNNSIRELRAFGPKAAAALRQAGQILAPALATSLRQSIGDFTGLDLSLDVIPREIKKQIDTLGALGPAGEARLRGIGEDLAEAMAEGIKDGEDEVRKAREALNEAIAAGEEQVRASVEQARGNLESLGDSLANQVSEIIDKMDFGVPALQRQTVRIELESDVREAERALRDAQQSGLSGQALAPFTQNVQDAQEVLAKFSKSGKASLDTLQDALQGLQDRLQRRQLQFGLRTAQRELRDAQQSIGALTRRGGLNEDQQRAISEALDPFRENVAQAKGELRTFDLSTQIAALEKVREQAKKTATEGITRLIKDFQEGRKSAGQFEKELRTLLGPQLDALKRKAGTNLGLSFTQNFLRTFKTLVTQAQLLTGFLDVLGTEPGPKAEDPRKAQTAAQKARQQAAENLREAIAAQKDTAKNSFSQVRLLALILATLADKDKSTPVTREQVDRQLERAKARVNLKGLDN